MKIIAFIEQEEIKEKILKHLGLWPILKSRPGTMITAWLSSAKLILTTPLEASLFIR